MRALDLFSGAAGGWTLGLHRAGIETVAACEADPWRRAVYARNFPGVRIYDDVRTLTGERVLADVGAIDLLAGSPPCQDASTANAKGRGIDGERTGLFRDALRLVRDLRPCWVCLENVPGIRARGADRIIAELEEAGYAVWPLVVGAVHAGAPHLRKRVWFIAHAASVGRGSRGAGRPDPSDARQPEPAFHDANAAPVLRPSVARGQSDRTDAGAAADATGRVRPSLASGAVADGSAGPAGRGPFVAGACADARDPDSARLAQREGIGGDARPELPPAIRAIGEASPGWNGGAAGLGLLDDGLPRGVARSALAAYGDAVCPQITEAIGRAILGIDAARRLAA